MSGLKQEFFWTPHELQAWLIRVCDELGLWLVLWRVGRNADNVNPDAIQPSMFESVADDAIQIFLGSPSICPKPVWRIAGDRRELDFIRSYAVQLVPSVLAVDHKTMLQGRLAIMRPVDYDDSNRAKQVAELFKQLRAKLRQDSDRSRIIVQQLPDGDKKRWQDVLVGKSVPKSGLKLKQFSRGEVEFGIETA
jgi:hypothetical protein